MNADRQAIILGDYVASTNTFTISTSGTSTLVAYDDDDGLSIFSKYIDGHNLQRFLNGDGPIHYEEMFNIEKEPARVVYWAHSPERGWVERKEINLK